MSSSIKPNREQFVELASSADAGPVVMLNLLKFKARAEGESGSGADAYKRYGEAAVKMVEEQGGRVLWQGRADQILIGDPRGRLGLRSARGVPEPQGLRRDGLGSQ